MTTSRYSFALTLLAALVGTTACSVETTDDASEAVESAATLNAESAAFSDTHSIQFEYSNQFFIACDPNAAGEFVFVQGVFEGHVHETIDGQGRYHFDIQYRPVNVSGTGETTGTVYTLRGAANDQFSGQGANEFSFTHDFALMGAGPRNDLIVHFNSTFGVSEDGVLAPSVLGDGWECK